MKRILCAVLSFLIVLSFIGCASSQTAGTNGAKTEVNENATDNEGKETSSNGWKPIILHDSFGNETGYSDQAITFHTKGYFSTDTNHSGKALPVDIDYMCFDDVNQFNFAIDAKDNTLGYVIKDLHYIIGEETFNISNLGLILSQGSKQDDFNRIYNALIDNKDVQFSAEITYSSSTKNLVFTITGRGFKSVGEEMDVIHASDTAGSGFSTEAEKPTERESGKYKYIVLEDGTAEITALTKKTDSLTIPSTLDGYTVTRIGDYAMIYMGITSLTIPDTIVSIGSGAFSSNHFVSVDLPESIEFIGDNPFDKCEELATIHVSSNHKALATIDGVLFSKADKRLVCYPLAKPIENGRYQIPEGIQIIGAHAFDFGRNLIKIDIPSSVITIGDYAFYYSLLQSVEIPEGVTSIGSTAFGQCGGLKSISLPESLEEIGSSAFYNCRNLKSIEIPDGVKLKSNPFVDTFGIQIFISNTHSSLEFIDGVLYDKIDHRLIYYPRELSATTYTVEPGTTAIGEDAFNNVQSLTDVIMPDTVTEIGDSAFWNCEQLANISLSANLLSIDSSAFYGCEKLKTVELPGTVVSVGSNAFYECERLSKIVIPGSVETIGKDAFYKASHCIAYVEANSYAEQYCKANNVKYEYSESSDLSWLNS